MSRLAHGHVHLQTTPSTTWTISHALGESVRVDVFVDVNGTLTQTFPRQVSISNATTVVVTFTDPQVGEAYVS